MIEDTAFDMPPCAFENAARLFLLLSTSSRLRIVHQLCRGEQSATDLSVRVLARQPELSRHLAALFRSGLVARRRRAGEIHYRIADDVAPMVLRVVCSQMATDGERPGFP